ncbi:hypothetical protein [Hymenobacter convexus]|uniref:hypothetical protein n=1 Tax=Hymenobacter sp. CA1UV-4 TaxID=3063782 RepID=UPI0027124251|nr:hypothetical protein [Hymenobacter sp. CA1UV-4]MDO7852255.1 hypothetical protein [Hymenobacter sp. CA1UV-4]
MAFRFPSSLNAWKLGFCSALLFYAFGLGGTLGLAHFMPVADMCNPGLSFYTGLLTLVLGAAGLVVALLAFLVGYRTSFLKGFIVASALVLVGPGLLILA